MNLSDTEHLRNPPPREMRPLRAWLVWRFKQEPGEPRPRKVPFYVGGRARGKHGTPEDRAQLVTFEEAQAACMRGNFDGVGFCPTAESGIAALDFDNCVVDGKVHADVERLVAGTYAELSPSGRGVRAFVGGDLGNRKEHGEPFGFETFSSRGFVTFTGRPLPITQLLECEDAIAPVSPEQLAYCEQRFGSRSTEPAPASATATVGLSPEQIDAALAAVDPDCGYDDWLRIGMALHHETGGEGLDVWDDWSSRGSKYPGRDLLERKWDGFGQGGQRPTTAHALVRMANEAGAQIEIAQLEAANDFEAIVSPAGQVDAPGLPAFARDKKGWIEPTVSNTVAALRRADVCGLQIGHDAFRDEITVAEDGTGGHRPMTDADLVRIRIRLERLQFKAAPKELVRDAAVLVAAENAFDSAQLWLAGLVWDGKPRIERFLSLYMGCVDSEYHRAVGRYIWSGLAGRILEPGVKADMVPIYEGDQGLRKSSAIEAIVPAPEFFTEVDLSDKEDDTVRKLRGVLVAEIAELSGLHTRALESIKKFVVRRHEKWVPKYREFSTTFARRLLFIGTTNRTDLLADETGNRRWLPVHVTRADAEGIARDRELLWAEGAALFRQHGVCWQDAERLAPNEHDAYTVEDTWADAVRGWLEEVDAFVDATQPRYATPFTTAAALHGALHVPAKEQDRRASNRVSAILRTMGYEQTTKRIAGSVTRVWVKRR